MNLFLIELGDFSGDGHNISKKFYVNIQEPISPEALFENYAKNLKEIGFDLSDFADEYEDNSISSDQWDTLVGLGMKPWKTGDEFSDEDEDDFLHPLTEKDLIKIVMFFYTHGLDLHWEPFEIQATRLTGYYGSQGDRLGAGMVGYGLYN